MRGDTDRGREAGRVKRKANIGRAAITVARQGKQLNRFRADGMAVASEWSKFGAHAKDSMEGGFEALGKELAGVEVEAEVVKRSGTRGERAESSQKIWADWWTGGCDPNFSL